jgi:hypothetical protein
VRTFICRRDPCYRGDARRVYQLIVVEGMADYPPPVLSVYHKLDASEGPDSERVMAEPSEPLRRFFKGFKSQATASQFIIKEYVAFALLCLTFGAEAANEFALKLVARLPLGFDWVLQEDELFPMILETRDATLDRDIPT